MPFAAISTVLYDNVKNLVMQFSGISDGGDETLVKKVDVTALVQPCVSVAIESIEYEVSGGLVRLFWEADDPVEILDLAAPGNRFDYRKIGGMTNKGGASATGSILLSTMGFEIGSSYAIKLQLRKKF